MANPSDDFLERATHYATAHGILLEDSLGYGKDGAVFSTNVFTAIKVFGSAIPYRNERDCYFRLHEMDVAEVLGHNVPRILGCDETLWIIEMTTVRPPYILDFASAHLDYGPDFPPEVLEQWEEDRLEEFGVHWPHVRMLIAVMQDQYGIFLTDVHPRNIAFAEEADLPRG